jgi:hypothetical protein
MRLLSAVPSREKLLGAALVVGTTLALVFLLIKDFFAGLDTPPQLLYTFALLLPAIGFVIVLFGLYWANSLTATDTSQITVSVPETGMTAANEPVGEGLEETLDWAASKRYSCRQHTTNEQIESILREGAIRQLRTQRGHNHETAASMVTEGEWTDDRVAAAFLSEHTSYPLVERVRGSLPVVRTCGASTGRSLWSNNRANRTNLARRQ